jgi:hypothetical protein
VWFGRLLGHSARDKNSERRAVRICKIRQCCRLDLQYMPTNGAIEIYVCNSNNFFSNFCPYFASIDENPRLVHIKVVSENLLFSAAHLFYDHIGH